jgi:hypothetical protein
MILSELRDYIRARGRVTLSDMAVRFDKDPNALRGMVQKWISKGKVAKLADSTRCGKTCAGCAPRTEEIYVWVG